MALPEADVQPASVIAYCANPSPENIISQYGKRVIKISDHQVVKWGPDIAKEEAENPQIAYERVSRRIVRIPRVEDHAVGFFFPTPKIWSSIILKRWRSDSTASFLHITQT